MGFEQEGAPGPTDAPAVEGVTRDLPAGHAVLHAVPAEDPGCCGGAPHLLALVIERIGITRDHEGVIRDLPPGHAVLHAVPAEGPGLEWGGKGLPRSRRRAVEARPTSPLLIEGWV